MCGLTYIEDGEFIESTDTVELQADELKDDSPWAEILARFGTTYACGPGIAVRKAVAAADKMAALYEIKIWAVFSTYAVIKPVKA